MVNEFELKRRAMLGFWREAQENSLRSGHTPDFEESHTERDPEKDRQYVLLKDSRGNVCAVYRVTTTEQLRKLSKIPKSLITNGQDTPLN